MIDDIATASLRVGRLARWPFAISTASLLKLEGRLDHGLRALQCFSELRAGPITTFDPLSASV